MKKVFWFILLAFYFLSSNLCLASSADLFNYNHSKLNISFSKLNSLEKIVWNYNMTFTELNEYNILKSFELEFESGYNPTNMLFEFSDMDWSSFAWGFCCYPVGCLFIPFNKNKDDNQKMSYFYGNLSSSILSVVYLI